MRPPSCSKAALRRARDRQRTWPLDLCRPRRFQRPDRAAAGRGTRAGPRQSRAAARAQRLHDFRRLARRAEGRRRGGRDHAFAPPRRDRDGDRARARSATRSSTAASSATSARRVDQTHFVKHIVKYDGDYGTRRAGDANRLARPASARRHAPRRSRADRLHQRHDRRAQGLRPVPPRRARAVRQRSRSI